MDAATCPNRDMLADYALGRTSEAELASIASHVETCPTCQSQLDTLDGLTDRVITLLRHPIPHEVSSDEPLVREILSKIESITSASDLDLDSQFQEGPIPLLMGQYRLMEKLGQGGMGAVYKALHTKLKRTVAIKLLPGYRQRSPQAVARFHREMEAIGRLDHKNIVRAHDANEVDGHFFLVMEFVEGITLSSLVRRVGPLDVANSCDIVRQAAVALQHVHEHGLVHRDVKPSNLMLTTTGVVKLLDLGLARLHADTSGDGDATASGQIIGSADYMAPEQASDPRATDARADLYSLGCTLYFFLAGMPPFGDRPNRTLLQKVMAHANEDAVPIDKLRADVPGPLTAILKRMLAKNPADRVATAAEVAELLNPFSSGSDLAGLLTKWPVGARSALIQPDVQYPRAIPDVSMSVSVGRVPEQDPFGSVIAEKTRQFVGRYKDIAEIKRWLERNDRGFCLIRGNPGIGKSALMSALSRIASGLFEDTFDGPQQLAALLRSGAWPNVAAIPYFIVRGEITATPVRFLSTVLHSISRACDLPCVTVGTAEELAGELHRQLPAASKILRERRQKLLVLIDGLDEAVSAEGEASVGTSLLSYIPRDLPSGVFFVLAGRRRKELEELSSELQGLHEMELQGLGEDDIRDLLKLTIGLSDLETDYVRQVTRISDGNPLYLKFLIQALQEGRARLNDIRSLPKNFHDLLEKTFNRLLAMDRGVKLNVLMALALAREQLAVEQIAGIVEEPLLDVHRALDACAEVITERRNVYGRAVYRIFHDSFANYLRSHKDYASNLPEMSRRILRFAARRVPDRPAEPELLAVIERLFDGSRLDQRDAGPLSQLIERTSGLLTGHSLMLKNLGKRPFDELGPLLAALGRCVGGATARMTIDCLVAAAEQQPAEVGRVVLELVQQRVRGRNALVAQANAQAARIALEVVVLTCQVTSMKGAVREVLLAACAAADSNIRSLAIVSVSRLVHTHHLLGISIVRELANRSVRFGFIRPRAIEVFAGCAIGLFFERPNDENLVRELKLMARSVLARLWGLRLWLWLTPPVITVLWASVPSDYNPANPAEYKAYKKYVAGHPKLVVAVSKMVNFIDPHFGTPEEFARAVGEFDGKAILPEDFLSNFPAEQATESRAIAGDDSALEAAYQAVMGADSPSAFLLQDFLWRLRIVQIGRNMKGEAPLDEVWTKRAEELVRAFICDHHGIFQGACHVYMLAGMNSGIVFLAHQRGQYHLDLLKQLVDWAAAGQNGMLRWPETPRERQPDGLLMRLIDILAVEYGLYDPLARENTFFGMQCFLNYAPAFDEFLWQKMANVLARMSLYFGSEVARFLAQISDEHRERLQVRMNQVLPKEGVGTLLSGFRGETFYASVFYEPPGKKDGIRNMWMDCLRVLLGPQSMSSTLRYGAQRLLERIQHGGNGPVGEVG
jgi:serine/threonine protein kinase